MPLFIRKGSSIPVSEVISPMTGADWQNLSVNIYGLDESSFTLYEDDGETEGYLDGVYRNTVVSVKALASDTWQIDIGAANGNFATDYGTRTVKLRIHSDTPISAATVGGVAAKVTETMMDETALPFANTGASNISHVYEIEAAVSISEGETILVTTGISGDTNRDGKITLYDALATLNAVINQNDLPSGDINADKKLSLLDVIQILKNITE